MPYYFHQLQHHYQNQLAITGQKPITRSLSLMDMSGIILIHMGIKFNHRHIIHQLRQVLRLYVEMEHIVLAKVEEEHVHTTEVSQDGYNKIIVEQ